MRLKSIKKLQIQKLFPGFEAIDEEISYEKLINFANSLDSNVTMESFQKLLQERIIEMHVKDSKELYKIYSKNINFDNHNIKKNKASVDDYINLLNNIDYHFSVFELEVLSELLNYNIIVVGRTTQLVKDGIYVITPKKESQNLLMFSSFLKR